MEEKIVGHETLAVSNSAASLTVAGSNVTKVRIKVADAAIRWRADGTAPTAAVGFPEPVGAEFELTDEDEIANFRAIRSGGTNSELNVLYISELP